MFAAYTILGMIKELLQAGEVGFTAANYADVSHVVSTSERFL